MASWTLTIVSVAGLVYPILHDPGSGATHGPGTSPHPKGESGKDGVEPGVVLDYLCKLLETHCARNDVIRYGGKVYSDREALVSHVGTTLMLPKDPYSGVFGWSAEM